MERVEKIVAKMQKKNAIPAEGEDEDALADADETAGTGRKEPNHSEFPTYQPSELS